jgi:hypothetical protein
VIEDLGSDLEEVDEEAEGEDEEYYSEYDDEVDDGFRTVEVELAGGVKQELRLTAQDYNKIFEEGE